MASRNVRRGRRLFVLALVFASPVPAVGGTGTTYSKYWQVGVGSGPGSRAADLVVSARAASLAVAGESFLVSAFQPRSGAALWQYEVETGQVTALARGRGRVFAGGQTAGQWTVVSLDETTGAVRWSDAFDRAGFVDAAQDLSVAGGRVFAVGSVDLAIHHASRWFVRAYAAADGSVLWEQEHAEAAGVAMLATASRDTVWAAGITGPPLGLPQLVLRAYDARTGQMKWSRDWADTQGAYPTGLARLGNRVAVAGAAGNSWFVRVHDAETGRLLWQHLDRLAELPGDIVAQRGRFVVAGAEPAGSEYRLLTRAYEARSGVVAWERRSAGNDTPHGNPDATLRPAGLFVSAGRVVISATGFKSVPPDTFVWLSVLDLQGGDELAGFGFDTAADERPLRVWSLRDRLVIAGFRQPDDGGGSQATLWGVKLGRTG